MGEETVLPCPSCKGRKKVLVLMLNGESWSVVCFECKGFGTIRVYDQQELAEIV